MLPGQELVGQVNLFVNQLDIQLWIQDFGDQLQCLQELMGHSALLGGLGDKHVELVRLAQAVQTNSQLEIGKQFRVLIILLLIQPLLGPQEVDFASATQQKDHVEFWS